MLIHEEYVSFLLESPLHWGWLRIFQIVDI